MKLKEKVIRDIFATEPTPESIMDVRRKYSSLMASVDFYKLLAEFNIAITRKMRRS